MRKQTFKAVAASAMFLFMMFSCEKNQFIEEEQVKLANNSELTLKAAGDVQGRNLAANCFQCHGTNGYAGELKIAGEGAGGIIDEMNEMKRESVGDNIMNVHARAYTDAEIKLIADFISKQ